MFIHYEIEDYDKKDFKIQLLFVCEIPLACLTKINEDNSITHGVGDLNIIYQTDPEFNRFDRGLINDARKEFFVELHYQLKTKKDPNILNPYGHIYRSYIGYKKKPEELYIGILTSRGIMFQDAYKCMHNKFLKKFIGRDLFYKVHNNLAVLKESILEYLNEK